MRPFSENRHMNSAIHLEIMKCPSRRSCSPRAGRAWKTKVFFGGTAFWSRMMVRSGRLSTSRDIHNRQSESPFTHPSRPRPPTDSITREVGPDRVLVLLPPPVRADVGDGCRAARRVLRQPAARVGARARRQGAACCTVEQAHAPFLSGMPKPASKRILTERHFLNGDGG